MLYMLDANKNVVPVDESKRLTAYRWYEEPSNRRVAYNETGDTSVSTIFLGINQRMMGPVGEDLPPIVFETRVFGGPMNGHQVRYVTWDEAMKGHVETCRKVFV